MPLMDQIANRLSVYLVSPDKSKPDRLPTLRQELQQQHQIEMTKERLAAEAERMSDRRDWVAASRNLNTLRRALSRLPAEEARLLKEIQKLEDRVRRLEIKGIAPHLTPKERAMESRKNA